MFSKLALLVVSAFALGAIAAPQDAATAPAAGNTSQCDVGELHCCNDVQDADSKPVQNLAGLLGVALGTVTGQVGLHCISFTGNNCAAQPVCCTGNNFNGLLVVGCTPVNVGV